MRLNELLEAFDTIASIANFEEKQQYQQNNYDIENIENYVKDVIFNGPATVIVWKDGTKTVSKCQEGETYDKEKGLMVCILDKFLGSKKRYSKFLSKYYNESEPQESKDKQKTKKSKK